MYTVRLSNEFMHGALWVLGEDGVPTFLKIIDNDEKVQSLNEKIMDLYDSFFEIDSHDLPIWFNETREQANKDKMLALLRSMKDRLNEINDGSFCVVDLESEKLQNI